MQKTNNNNHYKTHSNKNRAAEEERDLITEYEEVKVDPVSCIAWAGVGFFAGIVLCNFICF